jgi:hypothetical protein
MDKKRLLDLKKGLLAGKREAENKLIAHGAPIDDDDIRERNQRRRERHTSLQQDWYNERDSWDD